MNSINAFFEARPAVTVLGFSREVGCCRDTIDLIRQGKIGASKDMEARIRYTIKKYGYDLTL
jgi:hypothetical protein